MIFDCANATRDEAQARTPLALGPTEPVPKRPRQKARRTWPSSFRAGIAQPSVGAAERRWPVFHRGRSHDRRSLVGVVPSVADPAERAGRAAWRPLPWDVRGPSASVRSSGSGAPVCGDRPTGRRRHRPWSRRCSTAWLPFSRIVSFQDGIHLRCLLWRRSRWDCDEFPI